MGLVFRVFGSILLGFFLSATSILILGFFGLLRNLPMIVNLALRFLNWFVRTTYRFYMTILNYIRPFVGEYFSLDILNRFPRIVASVLMSLGMFFLFYWISEIHLTIFTIGLALLHGLFIGIVWDEIIQPDGLHLGENIR